MPTGSLATAKARFGFRACACVRACMHACMHAGVCVCIDACWRACVLSRTLVRRVPRSIASQGNTAGARLLV